MTDVRDLAARAQHMDCEMIAGYYASLDYSSYPNKLWHLIEYLTDEAYALGAMIDLYDMREEVKSIVDKCSDK